MAKDNLMPGFAQFSYHFQLWATVAGKSKT